MFVGFKIYLDQADCRECGQIQNDRKSSSSKDLLKPTSNETSTADANDRHCYVDISVILDNPDSRFDLEVGFKSLNTTISLTEVPLFMMFLLWYTAKLWSLVGYFFSAPCDLSQKNLK